MTDPQIVARFDELDEVDIDSASLPTGLADLRDDRNAQRGRPGFGALAGRGDVFVRRPWDEEPVLYYLHLGPDGRRLRQVDAHPDGTAIRTGPDDWPFNPPLDLYDPDLAQWETDAVTFEKAWSSARACLKSASFVG
ncbi:hypothetical protein [Cryptosporangium arvum]|uniref:hypothetical protein n=1 Tax=Cryptosporangium arvum TaxID=80871 RepID=UPI0004B9510B|nr:hypothetical protein [Cryptosporangium arvum]